MKKFEYLILSYGYPKRDIEDDYIENIEELNFTLNQYGDEGWELIQIKSNGNEFIYFLKREKQ